MCISIKLKDEENGKYEKFYELEELYENILSLTQLPMFPQTKCLPKYQAITQEQFKKYISKRMKPIELEMFFLRLKLHLIIQKHQNKKFNKQLPQQQLMHKQQKSNKLLHNRIQNQQHQQSDIQLNKQEQIFLKLQAQAKMVVFLKLILRNLLRSSCNFNNNNKCHKSNKRCCIQYIKNV